MTILAICILRKHFKSSKGEWSMMAKKAESYLKSKNLKDYKDLIARAMEIIEKQESDDLQKRLDALKS
jgi:hypothetical protein